MRSSLGRRRIGNTFADTVVPAAQPFGYNFTPTFLALWVDSLVKEIAE
jgi:hypothetical protein